MNPPPVITLTTDFGTSDWYVGVMKGVILGINPHARIIDLCHHIPPGDIIAAGFTLLNSYCYFPEETIHCVVVDPGVGSGRKILLAEAAGYRFLAPDNGILGIAPGKREITRLHSFLKGKFQRDAVSATFHGRDIFAPVAAYLSRGIPLHDFGPECADWKEAALPAPRRISPAKVEGEVIHVDRFGNLVTTIRRSDFPFPETGVHVIIGAHRITGISRSYTTVPAGSPLAIWGSGGRLEISVNRGHAASALGAKRGTRLTVSITGGNS